MQYSSPIDDLQRDSDDELNTERDVHIELPIQDSASHFRKFDIKFRNKESKEDAKSTLLDLEKDQLLLDLYYQLLLMKNWKENCKLSAFLLKKKSLSTSSVSLFLRRSDSLVNRKVLLNVTLLNSKD